MENSIENIGRYFKITETFCYLPDGNTVKFIVKLKRKNKEGDYINYQSEYSYIADDGSEQCNLNLIVNSFGWQIGKYTKDHKLSVYITSGNLLVVRNHLNNILNEWYLTKKGIFKNINNNLIIQGKWNAIQIPFDDYNFISFAPIVYNYNDGKQGPGCRIFINSNNNYVDLDINEFLNFCSCLMMDTGSLVNGLINYVNTCPTGINSNKKESSKNFFTK